MIRTYDRNIFPAMQAASPPAYGIAAFTTKSYKINCFDWIRLSSSGKLSYAKSINPKNPQASIRSIDQYCNAKIIKGTKPAGQADSNPPADMTFTVDANGDVTGSTDANGHQYDASGNDITPGVAPIPAYSSSNPEATNPVVTAGTTFGPTGNVTSTTSGTTTTPASAPLLTPQQQTALYNTIGSILNTTGSSIAAAIQANNQMQIAQMQSRAQIEIATLQTEAQRSLAAGNVTLAQQQQAQMAALQQFNGILSQQSQSTTTMYVLGAVAVIAIVGAAIVFWPKGQPQSSSTQPLATQTPRPTNRPKRQS